MSITHLEHDWHSPVWRHWLESLGEDHRLARYDERGCGLSDRHDVDVSLDAWVADLETVVDAAGLDTFPPARPVPGRAVAIASAARHPERVSKLVLYGTYARGKLHRGLSPQQRREAEGPVALTRVG